MAPGQTAVLRPDRSSGNELEMFWEKKETVWSIVQFGDLFCLSSCIVYVLSVPQVDRARSQQQSISHVCQTGCQNSHVPTSPCCDPNVCIYSPPKPVNPPFVTHLNHLQ